MTAVVYIHPRFFCPERLAAVNRRFWVTRWGRFIAAAETFPVKW